MQISQKTVKQKQWAVIVLILFFVPFHIALSPDYWDDAIFGQVMGQYRNDLIQYTRDRYTLWSSRITIEMFLPVMTALPAVFWKTLDLCMIVLLYYDVRWTLIHVFKIDFSKLDLCLSLLLCAFPFSIMAQTGWIATTMNYLWVVALGWYAANRILQGCLEEQRPTRFETICCILAVAYSVSYESMDVLLLLVCSGAVFYAMKHHRRVPANTWICLCICIGMLAYILRCPGNVRRQSMDIGTWMPEYSAMSLIDKLRMAVLSTFMHFVSIPSPVFFLLNLAVFMISKGEKIGKRLFAALPLCIDVFWTGYFMLNYLLGYRSFTYQTPEAMPTQTVVWVEQGGLLLSVLLWFAAVLYTLFCNIPRERAVCGTCILFLLCAPEMAVGITPTVVASILRTTIYLYMAMIILILVVMSEDKIWSIARNRKVLYAVIICGMGLNACQIARHIMIYG